MVLANDRRIKDIDYDWSTPQKTRKALEGLMESGQRVTVHQGENSALSGYVVKNDQDGLSIAHNKRSKPGPSISTSDITGITSSRKNRAGEKEKYL